MMGSVQMVGVRQVRVMRGFFVLTGLVMLGRHSVMFRGLLVVLGRFFMVLVNFEGHGYCFSFSVTKFRVIGATFPLCEFMTRTPKADGFIGLCQSADRCPGPPAAHPFWLELTSKKKATPLLEKSRGGFFICRLQAGSRWTRR